MQPIVVPEQHVVLLVGRSTEIRMGNIQINAKLWLRRNPTWVPTVTAEMSRIKYLHLTNHSDKEVTLDRGTALGWIMAADMVPRYPSYVSVGSRRYNEWKTLVFEATTEKDEELPPEYAGPLVDHPPYPKPTKILSRPKQNNGSTDSTIRDEAVISLLSPLRRVVNTIEEKRGGDRAPEEPMKGGGTNKDRDTDRLHYGWHDVIGDLQVDHRSTSVLPRGNTIQDQTTNDRAVDQSQKEAGLSPDVKTEEEPCPENDRIEEELDVSTYRHESGELYAKDVDQHLAVLPEIVTSTAEVTIDGIQVGYPDVPLTDDQEQLRQLVWRNKNLLIGKGNALLPAAQGAICDIDVGGSSPIAQRIRSVAPKFREKLADLIKGLLSAKIIRHSASPWALPIVLIIKKNGEDI